MAERTKKELDDLKANWCGDPCWEIEDTEGFEDHHDELLQFHEEMLARWEALYQFDLRSYASKIGLDENLKLAERIRKLDERIEKLETYQQLHGMG